MVVAVLVVGWGGKCGGVHAQGPRAALWWGPSRWGTLLVPAARHPAAAVPPQPRDQVHRGLSPGRHAGAELSRRHMLVGWGCGLTCLA